MKRRTLLASIPLASFATAGCTALPSSGSDDTAFVSDSPLAEYPCPPAGIDESGFVCTYSNSSEQTDVTLRPSTRRSDAATDIDLILNNDSETRTLEFNPCNWNLWVEQADGWKPVEEGAGCQGYAKVPPGETYEWDLEWTSDYVGQDFTFSSGTYFAQSPIRGSKLATIFRISGE